jgi:hypothetical protein
MMALCKVGCFAASSTHAKLSPQQRKGGRQRKTTIRAMQQETYKVDVEKLIKIGSLISFLFSKL